MKPTSNTVARFLSACIVLATLLPPPALARATPADLLTDHGVGQALQRGASRLPATGDVEYAFSPGQGAERLVLAAITSARQELRVLAYSFTSAPVTAALIAARRRGVDVAVLVDRRNNLDDDRSGKAKAALGTLALAGVRVRTIGAYPIHHDKVIVADRATVQTGSFNYSAAAANANSENVLVLWNHPQLAQAYLAHWERNWRQGSAWLPAY